MPAVSASRERHLIHRGRKFDFETITFTNAAGARVVREVVRHPGAVVILAVGEAGGRQAVVMIRNHRFTLDRELWELPAGTREAGEEPIVTAGRELEEETGYTAARIEPLSAFYTTPGMTDELMHAFVGRDLTRTAPRLEEDERIEAHLIPVQEVLAMVDRGDIVDGKSLVAILTALRRGILHASGG